MHKDLIPEIQYARHGGIAVAYQAVGDGPQELVFVPFLSSLISIWELPAMRAFFDRLSAETRLTVLNPRGMGQSDRPATSRSRTGRRTCSPCSTRRESSAQRSSVRVTARTHVS